jgi:hypothetical protein
LGEALIGVGAPAEHMQKQGMFFTNPNALSHYLLTFVSVLSVLLTVLSQIANDNDK